MKGVKPADFLWFDAKNQPQKINVLKSGAKVGLAAITTKKRRWKNIKTTRVFCFYDVLGDTPVEKRHILKLKAWNIASEEL